MTCSEYLFIYLFISALKVNGYTWKIYFAKGDNFYSQDIAFLVFENFLKGSCS